MEREVGEGIGDSMAIQMSQAALGAPRYSSGRGRVQMCRQAADVFTPGGWTRGAWTEWQSLESPNPVPNGNFGRQVALSGSWLAVTQMSSRDAAGADSGVVYLYYRDLGTTWTLAATLTAPARRPQVVNGVTMWDQMRFGNGVALDGTRLVVQDEEIVGDVATTTLRFYRLRYRTYEPEGVIEKISLQRNSSFLSMSLKGDVLAVGEPSYVNAQGRNTGRTLVIRRSGATNTERWKLEQVIEPPASSPLGGMGSSVGFTDDGELVMSSTRGFWTSTWDGKKWSPVQNVEVQPSELPLESWGGSVAVGGSLVVAPSSSGLTFMRRSNAGWKLERQTRLPASARTLALSDDTLLFQSDAEAPSWIARAVSFLSLGEMEVSLGKARSGEQNSRASMDYEVLPHAEPLTWRATVDGKVLPLTVIVSGPGLSNLPNAKLSGTSASFFGITRLEGGPAGETRFEVKPLVLLPAGDRAFTITFSMNGLTPDHEIPVLWQASGAGNTSAPVLISSHFQPLDKRMILSPAILGGTAGRFVWRRDGKELAGQTSAVLDIAAAKPEDAGAYELEILGSGQAPCRSGTCQVVIYEPIHESVMLRDTDSARLKTKFWGNASVVWQNPNTYRDMTHPFIAGVHQPTLTLMRGSWIGLGGMEELQAVGQVIDPVSRQALSAIVIARHTIFSIERAPRITPIHEEEFPLNVSISAFGVMADGARDIFGAAYAWPGSRVTASGLPPGITLDGTIQNGYLTGTFEKAGLYRVTWKLTDAAGRESAPVVSEFRIGLPMQPAAPGLYAGMIAGSIQDPEFQLGGILQIRMEDAGTFSGVLRVNANTRRFAGKLTPRADFPEVFERVITLPALRGTRSTRLVVESSPTERSPTARMLVTFANGEEEVWDSTLYHRKKRATLPTPDLLGRFNVLLDFQENHGEIDPPVGSGLMSLSVNADLTALSVGSLANGASFTASSPIMEDGLKLPFYHHDALQGGTLAGELAISTSDPYPLFVEGVFEWKQLARPSSKLYPEGFAAAIRGEGWRYIQPPPGITLMSDVADAPGNAYFRTDFFEHLFRLTTNHRAIPHATRSRSRLQQLDFHPPTGFFIGKFIVGDLLTEADTKLPARSVDFRGVMLPPSSAGGGFFFFPRVNFGGSSHYSGIAPRFDSSPAPMASYGLRLFGDY